MKYLALLASLALFGCSEITLLRTKEIRSVESNMKLQIDSLKYVVDSLSQVQISMARRIQADLRLILSSLNEGNDKLQMRLEENQYILDKLSVKEQKAPKVKLSAGIKTPAVVSVLSPSATGSSGEVKPVAIVPPSEEDAELDEMYTKARSFFNEKKYKESFLAFKEVYEKDSKGAYAEKSLYWMANSYDQTGQSENAITVLDRLLLEFPGGVKTCQTLFQKGRLFGDLKKVEEQKQVWQTLIDDPGCAGSNEAFRAGDLIGKLAK